MSGLAASLAADENDPHTAFRREVRTRAVEYALDRLNADGWSNVHMSDVAAAVGVSRPTLYAEFGRKEGLADAIVGYEADRFLEGVLVILADHGDEPVVAIRRAADFAFARSAESVVVREVLTSAPSVDDGEAVGLLTPNALSSTAALVNLVEPLRLWFSQQCPGVGERQVAEVADAVIRLVASHILTPNPQITDPGATIARLTLLMLPELADPKPRS